MRVTDTKPTNALEECFFNPKFRKWIKSEAVVQMFRKIAKTP